MELVTSAQAVDLDAADVQRDYLLGWFIAGLFRESAIADDLVLKGGNSLRKGYFPGTRFSDDIDLSSSHPLDSSRLLDELNRVCRYVEANAGVAFDIERNELAGQMAIDRQRTIYAYNLYFKEFLDGVDHITLNLRVDVTQYDRLFLPPQIRRLLHPYSDADACVTHIRCVKLEEAIAEKLKCLLQRRHSFDLFDLVYAIAFASEIELDRVELMQVFLRKTIFGRSPRAAKSLLLDLPLDLFRGYWNTVVCPSPARIDFDDAVSALTSGLESLFGPLPEGAEFAATFYPSRLRNPIMEAATERKLLRVRYDGVTRMIEPYSLTYKMREDGRAFEYFYVYDQTGGRSGPGIKCLFQHKVEFLEITDQPFEPRYRMELTKAGDASKAGTFVAQKRSRSASNTGLYRASPFAARTYTVTCASCGKTFGRAKPSRKINAHSDKYGRNCPGRRAL
ncbi:MAG: hypothetical protein JWM34_1013 [Ilumatobacteraceae bacterium]|nr:hypothetical protein [Ilumatobacteraceae bacterium]